MNQLVCTLRPFFFVSDVCILCMIPAISPALLLWVCSGFVLAMALRGA